MIGLPTEPLASITAALLNGDFSYFDISAQSGFLDIENTAQQISPCYAESSWEVILTEAKSIWQHTSASQGNVPDLDSINAWRNRVRTVSEEQTWTNSP
jgi:hypothetical protein